MESEHAGYERADGFQRLLRPVDLGRMAGVREHAYLDRAIRLPLRNGDLRRRAVFVVLALHDQDRHADVGQIFVDPPVPEISVEPGLVPAPERHVDVAVILGEPRAQIAGLVGIFRRRDRAHRNILDEEMRRDQHEAAHAEILARTGVDRGDRGAVAVAEKEAAAEADRIEQPRQHIAGLVVHEVEWARQRNG